VEAVIAAGVQAVETLRALGA